MQPLSDIISVIVCTYNQESTIGRTLDSILAQQCSLPLEIVVGEDHSTDGTLAVCRAYEQRHPGVVRILRGEQNKGFVRNYFDCLRACRGKYVADCSGDDFWTDTTKLEQELHILYNGARVGLVHTDWMRYCEETGQMTSPGPARCAEPCVSGQLLLTDILTPGERPAVHLCTSMYRNDWVREAMQRYPQFFDPERYRCEDVQITFLLAMMGDIAYIDTPTLAYGWGAASESNPASEAKQFRFWQNMTQLSFDLAQTFGISNAQLDRFFDARILKLYYHAFLSHEKNLCREARAMQTQLGREHTPWTLAARCIMQPGLWQLALGLRKLKKALWQH